LFCWQSQPPGLHGEWRGAADLVGKEGITMLDYRTDAGSAR
jgi:hypothetical protein